jgi:hypothetical protein
MNRRYFMIATLASLWTLLSCGVSWAVERTPYRGADARPPATDPPASDPRAALVDAATFALMGELELRRAIRLQYYVSLLMVHVDARAPQRPLLLDRLVEAIRDEIRNTDVIGVTANSAALQVLLVSTGHDSLPGIVARIFAAVDRRIGNAKGWASSATLSIGGAGFPTVAHSWNELCHQAEVLSLEAKLSRQPRRRSRTARTRSPTA